MSPVSTQILCFSFIAPDFYERLDSLKFEYYERSAAWMQYPGTSLGEPKLTLALSFYAITHLNISYALRHCHGMQVKACPFQNTTLLKFWGWIKALQVSYDAPSKWRREQADRYSPSSIPGISNFLCNDLCLDNCVNGTSTASSSPFLDSLNWLECQHRWRNSPEFDETVGLTTRRASSRLNGRLL